MADLKAHIAKVASGEPLTADESRDAFDIMMSGGATPTQIGALLMGLRIRGETVDEILGAVMTMRAKMLAVEAPEGAVDIVGTGGDGAHTYNISTLASIIVAGCGVPVAKHGNRAVSSKSGTADALSSLGVKLDITPDITARCISEAGIGFMFAQAHHSAMRFVGPSRVELGTRTIFNLLGPLSNPAGAKRQLLGVYSQQWLRPIAQVLKNLGSTHVWVVYGNGLDEITLTGQTNVMALENGEIREFTLMPSDFGMEEITLAEIRGGDGEHNAAALKSVLEGAQNAYRNISVANAAAALIVAGKAHNIMEGVELAEQSLASGAAKAALDRLVAVSNS
jgi:anthranilate phosphoribosyltransferase